MTRHLSDSSPKVSVVVTTYNRKHLLQRCLESLAAQTFPADEHEIVVIADGCTDGTAELLRYFSPSCHYQWREQANQGQPASQNTGVTLAHGEYVLFIDDDCICDPELIAAHYEAHATGNKMLVLGALLPHPDSPSGTPADLQRECENAEYQRLSTDGACRKDMMLCANSSIARQAALKFPFNPTYKRIHDVEAGIRLWREGYRPRFARNAIAYEVFMKTAQSMLCDANILGRYEVTLSSNYPEFKPFSSLANLNRGTLLKRTLRRYLALYPRASEMLLRPVYSAAASLRCIPGCSSIAKRVLKARSVIAHANGAIQQSGSWANFEKCFAKQVPVIMYHNVGEPKPGEYPGLTTRTAEFEAQIRFFLQLGYRGIRPSEWLNWRNSGGALPERPLILVFDDGYADLCRNAFPVLERYGFPAACMIVTQYIGSTNLWDQPAGRPMCELMNREQILEWSQRGIEFGGHSATHPELPLTSAERAHAEVAECHADLNALLGQHPASFAYPFGGIDSIAKSAAQKHFEIAFTTWPGLLHLGTDLHCTPRVTFLPREKRLGMWCRLRFGKNPYELVRNRVLRMLTKSPAPEYPES